MVTPPARFPVLGVAALVIAIAALVVEVVLLAGPRSPMELYDPTDPDGLRRRAEAMHRASLLRFELGLGVLGVGSALAGWAALAASKRGSANRFLAGTAGVCFLAGWVAWLSLGVSCLSGPWDADDRGPPLIVVEYDR